MNDLIKRLRGGQLLEDGQRFIPHSDAMKLLSEAADRIEELEDDIAAIQRVAEKYQDEAGKSVARMDEMADEIQFLTWHSELCRDDARRFYRDHLRYEYVRRLNVRDFALIFERALKGALFDALIDGCIAGCRPDCRVGNYRGCAICMSPTFAATGAP